MRAVVQRVSSASVVVEARTSGAIDGGLLVLLGVCHGDDESDSDYLLDRIAGLRIFADGEGKMNLSLRDTGGALLVVSQFTLYGDTRKGRRPSFDQAAPPSHAQRLYDYFVERARAMGIDTATGIFQANMSVHLVNEGPVTLILESKPKAESSADRP